MNGRTVLVVEDDAFIRQQVFDALSRAYPSLRLAEAGDGVEGLKAIDRERPDLVLLDLFMPNKSGLETLSEIRARSPALKVVVMSSLDSDSLKAQVLAAGANAFIAKPFHPVELAEEVRKHLSE